MPSPKSLKQFYKERISQEKTVGIINLGCARNLVDSQVILGRLKGKGVKIVNADEADIAVVNTCGFIEEAKQESIDTILDLIKLKKEGKIKKIVVAGCLAQRYSKTLAEEFPEIDALGGIEHLEQEKIPAQVALTPTHMAYVKICESCYNRCNFCIIPQIKGKFISRTVASVLEEIRQCDARGVKEVNIVGQDITAYGMDLFHEKHLAKLLQEMVKITKNIQWIRLLYAYPAHITDKLIDVIAKEEKLCKYIDVPLQHISDPILKNMNRGITTQQTIELIQKIRQKVRNASIRTTFIVGLPGETDKHFDELCQFVQNMRFEKLGVFTYSPEEGTSAFDMPDQVPEEIKQERYHQLMQIQQSISQSIQERYIGQTLKVLIDEKDKNEENRYLGRTEFDAPDVDGTVFITTPKPLTIGDFATVTIKDTLEYDLIGTI